MYDTDDTGWDFRKHIKCALYLLVMIIEIYLIILSIFI